MKPGITFLFLALVIMACGKAGNSKKVDEKPKIKTCYTYVFNYSDKGGKFEPNYSDTVEFKGWQYNEKDELTQFIMRNSSGWDTCFYTYQYDEQGRIMEEIAQGDPRMDHHYTFAYDTKGNKIKEETIRNGGIILTHYFTYNDKNQRIVEEFQGSSIDSFWFDNKGNEIQKKIYNRKIMDSGYELDWIFNHEFNENGKNTKSEIFYKGKLQQHCKFSYDDKGSLTEMLVLNGSDSLQEHAVYRYVYDDKDNPIEDIVYDGKTQVPKQLTIYKYQYY